MKKNMGTLDRVIRLAVAVVIAALYLTGAIGGTVALVLGLLAVVFAATSAVSFCPLYRPFRFSTRRREPA